jgi:hypothetical protein
MVTFPAIYQLFSHAASPSLSKTSRGETHCYSGSRSSIHITRRGTATNSGHFDEIMELGISQLISVINQRYGNGKTTDVRHLGRKFVLEIDISLYITPTYYSH